MIPRIKRVLYATDLSKNAMFAFRYAMNTVEKHDAEMIVLHVIDEMPPRLRVYGVKRDIAPIKQETISELSRRLDEFCETELRDRPECMKMIKKVKVEEGNPVEVILKVAKEEECDIIIMGNHGAGMWTHTYLGNVAKRVLRRSEKPVYIIPLPKE